MSTNKMMEKPIYRYLVAPYTYVHMHSPQSNIWMFKSNHIQLVFLFLVYLTDCIKAKAATVDVRLHVLRSKYLYRLELEVSKSVFMAKYNAPLSLYLLHEETGHP